MNPKDNVRMFPECAAYFEALAEILVNEVEPYGLCTHTLDEDIHSALFKWDQEHGTELASRYFDSCYELSATIRPIGPKYEDVEVKIECRQCAMNKAVRPCGRKFPLAELKLKERWLESMGAFK